MEGKHLQAPSSNRTLDEAKKQVVSFLQWLDNWAVNVIPTCDRFHKESRLIFHIIIYKVINAFWFPPAFPSLLYETRGNGQVSLRNNTKNTEAHNSKIRLTAGPLRACAPQASIRLRQLWHTPALLVPSNAGLGLTTPGSPGDSSTLAPLLCFQAEHWVGDCGGSTPGAGQKSLVSTCTACRSETPQ